MKLLVNFFVGPCGGKTTECAKLFVSLKERGVNVEYVPEYAKELVLENNSNALSRQIWVFSNQLYKLQNAYASADVVLTDSPLLLSSIYNPDTSIALHDLILEQHHTFNNVNFLLRRTSQFNYTPVGRIHSLSQSLAIDNQIENMLDRRNVPHHTYNPSAYSSSNYAEDILEILRTDSDPSGLVELAYN